MQLPSFLASLNLVTLVIVVLIASIGLALFLRKPGNRHPMDTKRGREIEAQRTREAESRPEHQSGLGPDTKH